MKKANTKPAFTQSQVKGIIILGILLLLTTLFWRLSPLFLNRDKLPVAATDSTRTSAAPPGREYTEKHTADAWEQEAPISSNEVVSLFPFDPNTASEQDFIRLGLLPKVARTIRKYRSKGGRFYRKEDLSKIYTLSEADFQRLLPYIRIPETTSANKPSYTYYNNRSYTSRPDSPSGFRKYPVKQNRPIQINTCTAEELMSLRGIGTGYAGRIIHYREALGGFIAKEQLKEVYGMTDSLYNTIEPYIIIQADKVRKMNLNTATEAEWLQHPYTRKMARYILLYRKDIGQFLQIEDFRKVPLINEEKYRKIAPYLSL